MNPANNPLSHSEKLLISKSFKTEDLLLSNIHLSKKWQLPKYRAKRKLKQSSHSHNSTENESNMNTDHSNITLNETERKRIQNRVAQQSYRIRKENKLNNLEKIIESLQSTVLEKNAKISNLENSLNSLQTNYNKLMSKFMVLQNDSLAYKSIEKITISSLTNPDPPNSSIELETLSIKDKDGAKDKCQSTVTLCTQCEDIEKSCINSINSKILANNKLKNVNNTKINEDEIDFTDF